MEKVGSMSGFLSTASERRRLSGSFEPPYECTAIEDQGGQGSGDVVAA